MASEQVPAEALGMPAESRTLGLLLLVPVCDLDEGKVHIVQIGWSQLRGRTRYRSSCGLQPQAQT